VLRSRHRRLLRWDNMPPNWSLRALRNSRNVTVREVESESRRIAEAKGDMRFYISNARLTQLESNLFTEPSLWKLFSLSAIYKVRLTELMRLYNVEAEESDKYTAIASPDVTCLLTDMPDSYRMSEMLRGLVKDPDKTTLLPRVIDSQSHFFPNTEHIMGWDVTDSGFRVLLSADIAGLAQSEVRPIMEDFLGRHDLTIADIDHWLVHPGGPKVIEALEDGLGLPDKALALSWECLAEAGNISSASVLLILDKTMKRLPHGKPGDVGVLMAMGPAFSAELVLLQW